MRYIFFLVLVILATISYLIELKKTIYDLKSKIILHKENSFNNRPVIGILTQPSPYNKEIKQSYIAGSYVKFIEEAGAQVIPILYDYDEDTLRDLSSKINGIFFPGGDSQIINVEHNDLTRFGKTGKFLFELMKEYNSNNNYYPIFGVCLGHELISTIISEDFFILEEVDSENHINKIEIINNESKVFENVSKELKNYVTENNGFFFNHKEALLDEKYNNNENLKNNLSIISYSSDKTGKRFIASLEGRTLPIYTTQFHSEKAAFEWDIKENINHSPEMIKITQIISNFFVDESRKNENEFSNEDELEKYFIYNYHTTREKRSTFDEVYLFDAFDNSNSDLIKEVSFLH